MTYVDFFNFLICSLKSPRECVQKMPFSKATRKSVFQGSPPKVLKMKKYNFHFVSGSAVCTNSECVRAAGHILDHVDPDVDPCENFYNFACGTFLKKSFLRKKSTPLSTLSDLTKNDLKKILTENTTSKDLPHSLVIQRNFYR